MQHVPCEAALHRVDINIQECVKLGWKGQRTRWDILPIVVSSNGNDPEYFEIPPDLVVEVKISHPT